MTAKIQKLDEQFHSDGRTNREIAGSSTNIFSGVSIHVNGYTEPSSDELKKLMMMHGGAYQHYYSMSKVTHIIATNLPYTKIKELTHQKIVRPEWITDSIKAGRLLPYHTYELYKDRSAGQNQTLLKLQPAAAPKVTPVGSETIPNSGNQEEITPRTENDPPLPRDVCGTGASDPSVYESALDRSHDGSSVKPPGKAGGFSAKAGDPNFLSEFYSHSRLHHISTWGAECKAHVNELQRSGSKDFPGRAKLLQMKTTKEALPGGKAGEDWNSSLDDPGKAEAERPEGQPHGQKKGQMIMHIDMDCFFVSVGLINRPHLLGQPVAVTHSRGQGMSETNQEIRDYEKAYYAHRAEKSGKKRQGEKSTTSNRDVENKNEASAKDGKSSGKPDHETFNSMADIASCNYEARKSGVKNGMSMGKARTLCPDLQTIPYDFEGYRRVSKMLYDIIASYTHDIEAVSCDEMFVDISELARETGATPLEIAGVLREEIKEKTCCNASAGIAPNILLARMATRRAKPNGQFLLESHAINDFIKTQPVKDLPGVGWSTSRRMESLSIKTCGDLQQISLPALQKEFGPKTGQSLYNFCRGVDSRPIKQEQERKSVSAEVNYGIRFKQDGDAVKFVEELTSEVHQRLKSIDMQARSITLKLKVRSPDAPKETSKFMGHGICDDRARSVTLLQATDRLEVLQRETKKLLHELRVPAVEMRGVGIQLSKLCSSHPQQSSSSAASKPITAFLTKVKGHSEGPSKSRSSVTSAAPATASHPAESRPTTSEDIPEHSKDTTAPSTSNDGSAGHHDNTKVTTPRRRKKELPPLPFIPLSPPESGGQKTDQTRDALSGVPIPSPLQIDPSVLAALPEDIQRQVLEDYHHHSTKAFRIAGRDEPSTSSGITHSNQLDSDVLRSLPPEIQQEVMQSHRHGDVTGNKQASDEAIETLPSFSQIDPSCLEALPPDLQDELKSAYKLKDSKDNLRREAAPANSHSGSNSLAKASPTKSPFKIRRRGRPRKGSPRSKATTNKPRWQPGIREIINRKLTPPKPGPGIPPDVPSPSNDSVSDVLVDDGSEKDGSEGEERASREEEVVNLCGAVQLGSVKGLLKEWIDSTEEPVEEDIGYIVQYLRELILDKNLEMVSLVIRSLKRLTARKASPHWIDAQETVVARIQHTMDQIYSAQLDLA
ncbi:DNA repair protein REV1-like [Diadema setosum]|uniref:DNA repair protein REV1-like n=1 Tax=Diadema setosum TaxID=31175 RepID=UPI003B3A59F3